MDPELQNAALIALGSNLGDRLEHLRAALPELRRLGRIVRRSSLYQTEPQGGPAGQADYLNAVLMLKPRAAFAEPETLLKALLEAEARHGRERRVRWAARTLDLDLLAHGNRVVHSPTLTLPHPRMLERAFVLAPLCDVAPTWRHPLTQQTACDALQHLSTAGVVRSELVW